MACYLIINCWSHSDLIELKEPPAGRIIAFELREGGVDTAVAAGRACGPVAVLTEASKEVSGREEVINEDVIFGFGSLLIRAITMLCVGLRRVESRLLL